MSIKYLGNEYYQEKVLSYLKQQEEENEEED